MLAIRRVTSKRIRQPRRVIATFVCWIPNVSGNEIIQTVSLGFLFLRYIVIATILLFLLCLTPDLILLGFQVCLMHYELATIRRQQFRKNNLSVAAIAYFEVTSLGMVLVPRFSQKSVQRFVFVPPFFIIKVPNLLIEPIRVAVLFFWRNYIFLFTALRINIALRIKMIRCLKVSFSLRM